MANATPTLTDFLLARIAEDEAVARDEQIENVPADCWGPARVLAECEAKRRIAEAFADAECAVDTYDGDNPTPAYWQEWGNRHALALAVEHLATIYADHPDYDESWRP